MLNEIMMFAPLLASVTLVYIVLQVLSWFDGASTSAKTFRNMGMSNIDIWFHFNVPKTAAKILLPPTILLTVINVLTLESPHYPRGMIEMILSLYFVICVSLLEIVVIIITSPQIVGEIVVESGLALQIWNEIVEVPRFVFWMVCIGWTESLQYVRGVNMSGQCSSPSSTVATFSNSRVPLLSSQRSTTVPKVSTNVSAQVQVKPVEESVVQVQKGSETTDSVVQSVPTCSASSPSSKGVQSNVVATPPSPPSSSSSKAAQSNVVASPPSSPPSSPSSSPPSSPSSSSSASTSMLTQGSTADSDPKKVEQKKKVSSFAPRVQEYDEVEAPAGIRRTATGKKRAMSYTSEGHRIVFKHSIDERIAIREQQTEVNRQIVHDLYAVNEYLKNLEGPIPESEIERDLHRDRLFQDTDLGVDDRLARALGKIESMVVKKILKEDESFRLIGSLSPIETKSCLKRTSTLSSPSPLPSSSSSPSLSGTQPRKAKKTVGFSVEEPEECIVPFQDPSRRPYERGDYCYHRAHPTWKQY